MNLTTRKTAAEVALRAAKRLWVVLMNSDRSELVDAGERLARAASDLRRATTNKDKAQAAVQTRQALHELVEAIKSAGAMLSVARSTDSPGRHADAEPKPSLFTTATTGDEVLEWDRIPSGDF